MPDPTTVTLCLFECIDKLAMMSLRYRTLARLYCSVLAELAVCLEVEVPEVAAAAAAEATAEEAGLDVGEGRAFASDLFMGTREGGAGTVAEVAATTGREIIVDSSLRVESGEDPLSARIVERHLTRSRGRNC